MPTLHEILAGRIARLATRVSAAHARADAIFEAYELLGILTDAVADTEDAQLQSQGAMTLAEARSAYECCAYDEATSIALEGLEQVTGHSFLAPSVIAPTLSATTLTLCQRALETRLAEVQIARCRAYPSGSPVFEELGAESEIIREALAELAGVLAATPGTSAA